MTSKERSRLLDIIEVEGLEVAVESAIDIKDEGFQQLRRTYLSAKNDLEEYIGIENL